MILLIGRIGKKPNKIGMRWFRALPYSAYGAVAGWTAMRLALCPVGMCIACVAADNWATDIHAAVFGATSISKGTVAGVLIERSESLAAGVVKRHLSRSSSREGGDDPGRRSS